MAPSTVTQLLKSWRISAPPHLLPCLQSHHQACTLGCLAFYQTGYHKLSLLKWGTRRHRWIGSSSFALSSTSSSIVYFPLDKISILIDKPSDLWIRPDNDNFPFPYIRLAAWLEMFKHTRPGRIVGQEKYNFFDGQISIFETPYCFLWGCRFPGSSNKSCPWWSRLRTPWRLWAVPLTSMAKPELYQISWTALFMDFCNNTSVFLQQHFSVSATSFCIFATSSIYTEAQQNSFDPKNVTWRKRGPNRPFRCLDLPKKIVHKVTIK